MTLRGLLRSFPPLEVLQFLTNSGKTGTLRVYDESDAKLLAFERGQLLYAIHQRRLPPLTDLLAHRGVLGEQKASQSSAVQVRWDDVVSRVLARHRSQMRKYRLVGGSAGSMVNRLGPVLVTQGRLDEQQLQAATDPETIPDRCLKTVLKDAGVMHTLELLDSWSGVREGKSLYSTIIERNILTAEEIRAATTHVSDETLAEILVYQGVLTRTEIRLVLDQLESLRDSVFPSVRLGEYMVAKGQISRRQLERALSEQFSSSELLGTILVNQKVVSQRELDETTREIEHLRSDFGPLQPLRRMLEEQFGLERGEFAQAVCAQRQTGRQLVEVLAETSGVSPTDLREAIEAILILELCDLLIWPEAAFEFYEGFSLADALNTGETPVPHDEPFELQPLLLNACRDLDEIQNRGVRGIFPGQVFTRSAAGGERDATDPRRRVLRRIDGRRSLHEVCRVLPGNRLSHFMLFVELVGEGEIEPLSRESACEAGNQAFAAGRFYDALVLYNHALGSPGAQPSNYRLRRAVQDARLASEKRFLWRAVLRARRLISSLYRAGRAPAPPGFRRRGWIVRWLRTNLVAAREGVSRALVRGRLGFENFVMRRSWARGLWTLKEILVRPFERVLGRGSARAVVVLGAAAAGLLIGMAHALPEQIPDLRLDLPNLEVRPVPLRSAMARREVGAPVEVAPTVTGQQIFVAARDGYLRAMQLQPPSAGRPAELSERWQVRVGEYGDILSQPLHDAGRVFVANVRGTLSAVSADGEIHWQQTLSRLEPMPPTPLYSEQSELVGLAVASRERAYVLDPEHGRILYCLQTGNRISARPAGDQDHLFVGSGDAHLYMVRWREGRVLWEHEASDDVTWLQLHGGVPVFATRDGHFAALDPQTGTERWVRTMQRNAVRSMGWVGPGEIYVEKRRGEIEIVRPATGEVAGSIVGAPTLGIERSGLRDGRLFYASNSGFVGELEADGQPRWRSKRPVGDITGWDIGAGFVAIADRGGELVVFFRRAGGAYGH